LEHPPRWQAVPDDEAGAINYSGNGQCHATAKDQHRPQLDGRTEAESAGKMTPMPGAKPGVDEILLLIGPVFQLD